MDPEPRIDTLRTARALAKAGLEPKAANMIVDLLDAALRVGTVSPHDFQRLEARIERSKNSMIGVMIVLVLCILVLLALTVATAGLAWQAGILV